VPSDAETAALGARLDFHECGPCGGACCKVGWTVLATPADLDRLERATGRPAREFARFAPLPAWEQAAFGEGNLLFPRVADGRGAVPQLRKREDGACVFLDVRGMCGVHAAKPLLCRLFPFYYETGSSSARERPSPRGTIAPARDGRPSLRLLVDRGHAGFCPIPESRIAEVEEAAGDAAIALARSFEAQVEELARADKGELAARLRPDTPT